MCDNPDMHTKVPWLSGVVGAGAGLAVLAMGLLPWPGAEPGSRVVDMPGMSAWGGLRPVSLRGGRAAWAADEPEPNGKPREAVVVMDDGTRYSGMLISQDDETVVLEIGGIELRLDAGEVGRIDVLPPIRERYERLRGSISDDDIPALLNLVDWLVSRGELELAGEELLGVMRQEPRHPRALELQRLIEAQKALAAAPESSGAGGEGALEGGDPDRRSKESMPVLSPEEINLIRVYELDMARLPRIVVKRETVERLIEEFAGDPLIPSTIEGRDELFRAARTNPRRVLEIIFRLKARHLYPEIQVIDNPRAMQMFRERVHGTWLVNACASCHNTRPDAPDGPRFITRRPNSDATVYSNFLILDRYRMADGTALVNYDEPEKSPLLHLGMARAISEHPHPDVAAARGWSPVFLSTSSNNYQSALAWIRAMYRPRPEYPIDYPPDAEGLPESQELPAIER